MSSEISRLEIVQRDNSVKESTILQLKKQMANLDFEKNALADDTSRRLSIFQNQITLKNDEIDHLQNENRQLKSVRYNNTTNQTNKIAELQTLLTRHDQNISSMELQLEKMNKEKLKLSSVITTLQKEISAKDLLLKRSKTETEKYRLECRNKDMDISSLTAKVPKNSIHVQDLWLNIKLLYLSIFNSIFFILLFNSLAARIFTVFGHYFIGLLEEKVLQRSMGCGASRYIRS